MAYNGFPATYQPMYYPQQYQPQMPQQPTQQYQQTSQNGFIRVQNENEARMYPVAPGSSVTFINENAPYCYTKTLGASQLDRPTFKRFRLVEEVDAVQTAPERSQSSVLNGSIDLSEYALKADMDALASRIAMIQTQIEKLNSKEDSGA